jgi:hypothetical protein
VQVRIFIFSRLQWSVCQPHIDQKLGSEGLRRAGLDRTNRLRALTSQFQGGWGVSVGLKVCAFYFKSNHLCWSSPALSLHCSKSPRLSNGAFSSHAEILPSSISSTSVSRCSLSQAGMLIVLISHDDTSRGSAERAKTALAKSRHH